jgi:predicted esterase
MRQLSICLLFVFSVGAAAEEAQPLQVTVGEMVEGVACISNPTQTYTLYIPSTYSSERRYPVLLVFDPRGRSLVAAEVFREAAEAYSWIIVSSDNTRSDGPMEPNTVALQALWPEVHERLPADFDRIYAAGFSGGAAVASVLSKATGELAGILACGGRFFPEYLEGNDIAVFATAGELDFNHRETHLTDEFLAKQGNPHRLVIFDGTHGWMPPAVAREAVEFFELVAMQRELRESDTEMVDSLFVADAARAEELVDAGRELDAARRFREIRQLYGELTDITSVGGRLAEIEASAAFRQQAKAARKARAFERRCDESVNNGLANLRSSDIPPPVDQLARDFAIDDLGKRAEKAGPMGLAALRCLNGLYTGLSFYIPRDAALEQRYAHAATAYELAVMVREDNPVVWYNLACMRARLGREDAAMDALSRAVDTGFNRTELLATDEDLDSLRDRKDFKKLAQSAAE